MTTTKRRTGETPKKEATAARARGDEGRRQERTAERTPSASSPNETDAFEILKAQHRNVEQLFGRLDSAGSPGDKRRIFRDLVDALLLHAAIEERHFYPSVRRPETEALVREALRDHASMEEVIDDLLDEEDEMVFDSKLATLQDTVERHVREDEEGGLFPLCERFLDEDLRQGIGQEMIATMVDLLGGEAVSEEEEGEPVPGTPQPHA